MSVNLPVSGHWWSFHGEKVELLWIIIAFILALTMLFGLLVWSGYGQHNLLSGTFAGGVASFEEISGEMMSGEEMSGGADQV